MANREALRELQTRLAQRLQQASTDARTASWLALECAGQGLLVPLPQAGEIFGLVPLQPVPHTRPWFLGVANLRGQLHGVVDLAAYLGLRRTEMPPAAAEGGPTSARDGARLVAINAALGAHCALRVDRLAGLRGAEQLRPAPADDRAAAGAAHPGTHPGLGASWLDEHDRHWWALDLAALAADERFLAIAA